MDDLERLAQAARAPRRTRGRGPILIEQTDKKWKGVQLGGAIWCVAGCGMFVAGSTYESAVFVVGGAIVAAIGFVVACAGATLAWWYHG